MSVAYAVGLLENNLEWVKKQLMWLQAAKGFKGSNYFDEEYKKFKSREASLEGAINLLKRNNKRRNNHNDK